jgi:hypothetical protein
MGPRLTGHLSYEVIRERRFTSGAPSPFLDETLAAPNLPPELGAVRPGPIDPTGGERAYGRSCARRCGCNGPDWC